MGFLGGSEGKNPPAMQKMQETWVQFLGQEDPLEKGMGIRSSILAWRIHGLRSLVGYSPWGGKKSAMIEVTKHVHMHVQVLL